MTDPPSLPQQAVSLLNLQQAFAERKAGPCKTWCGALMSGITNDRCIDIRRLTRLASTS